jgi:hypothetical protein
MSIHSIHSPFPNQDSTQVKVSCFNSVLHGDRMEHKRCREWHHSIEASQVRNRTLRLSFPSSISASIYRRQVGDQNGFDWAPPMIMKLTTTTTVRRGLISLSGRWQELGIKIVLQGRFGKIVRLHASKRLEPGSRVQVPEHSLPYFNVGLCCFLPADLNVTAPPVGSTSCR